MTAEMAAEAPAAAAPFTADELAAIRAQFLALSQVVNGFPLVYLDSGATSLRLRRVLDSEHEFLSTDNAAVHRGAHELAVRSTLRFEEAREAVAAYVGVGDPGCIVWTANATDALYLVATGIANASRGRGGERARRLALRPGDEIVVTESEHHANPIPWQELAAATGALLRWVEVRDDGTWRLEDLDAVLSDRTRLIAFAHVSNVTGMLAPVEVIVERARRLGAQTVLDACQSAPHRRLGLEASGVDFAAFSGHKMLGPSGIGVLYGRRDALTALPPARFGGSMISSVTMTEAQFLAPPHHLEAGTQPVSQAIALAEATPAVVRGGAGADHRARACACRPAGPGAGEARGRHPGRPRRGRGSGGTGELLGRWRPCARCRPAPRFAGHRRPCRPPLRAAAAPEAWRAGNGPGESVSLLDRRRGGRAARGARGVRHYFGAAA